MPSRPCRWSPPAPTTPRPVAEWWETATERGARWPSRRVYPEFQGVRRHARVHPGNPPGHARRRAQLGQRLVRAALAGRARHARPHQPAGLHERRQLGLPHRARTSRTCSPPRRRARPPSGSACSPPRRAAEVAPPARAPPEGGPAPRIAAEALPGRCTSPGRGSPRRWRTGPCLRALELLAHVVGEAERGRAAVLEEHLQAEQGIRVRQRGIQEQRVGTAEGGAGRESDPRILMTQPLTFLDSYDLVVAHTTGGEHRQRRRPKESSDSP